MTNIGIDRNYVAKENTKVIYLAGGCFWGVEKLVQSIPGVVEGTSGYANGSFENPTYEEVKKGNTNFRETVRVEYDSSRVSLKTILVAYFAVVDPSVENQQGNDIGSQYQTGIYYSDAESMAIVDEVVKQEKAKVDVFKVEISPLLSFYDAEEYHQNYLDKHPTGYCHISSDELEKVKRIIEKLSIHE